MRIFLGLFVAFALAMQPHGRAKACTCRVPPMSRLLAPADGADSFPVDGTIRVFLTASPPSVRAALASEYRLLDAQSQLVPFDSALVGTRLDLKPRAPLQPGATYELQQVFAFGEDGTRFGDDERLRGQDRHVRGAWFRVASFQTAATPSQRAPVSLSVSAARHFAMGGGDCGPGNSLGTHFRLPASIIEGDVVELHVQGQGVVDSALAADTAALYAGNMMCNSDPVTLAAGSLRYKVVVMDASGREVARSRWGSPPERPPQRWRPRRVRSPAMPTAWSNIQIGEVNALTPVGPTACAHGFEATARPDAAAVNAPRSYGARSTLSTNGREGWLAFSPNPESGTMLVHAPQSGAQRQMNNPATGFPLALASGRNGGFLISQVHPSPAPREASLVSFDRRGASRWTQPLGANGDAYRVAAGGGVVFAAWGVQDPSYQRHLSYALFDARAGSLITAEDTHFGIHTGSSEGPALAFVGGRFLLAWTPSLGGSAVAMRTMVVGRGGEQSVGPTILRMEGEGVPDMAGGGGHAALVTSKRGEILWALLDPEGNITRGPIVVSGAVPGHDHRLPRVAWNGSVFAVAWEENRLGAVQVVAVDLAGRVSPPTRLDDGGPRASTVALGALGQGFLTSFSRRGHATLMELHCRTSAVPGPPARIEPVASTGSSSLD